MMISRFSYILPELSLLQNGVDIDKLGKVLLPFVFIVGGLLLALIIWLYQRKKAKERTVAMQALANQLQWNFAENAPMNMIAGLDNFALFNQGHSKRIKNFMYGEA